MLALISDLLAPPLPDGLAIVELFGHVRVRGTVRRRWFGIVPMIEVVSHEPNPEPTRLVSAGSIYSLRAATADEADCLERDHAQERRFAEERAARARRDAERERRFAEADADPSKMMHRIGTPMDDKTYCDEAWQFRLHITTREDEVTCRECHAADDIPY